MNKLALELLRSSWLLSAESAPTYEALVADILAGKEIATGFFSSLQLPDVPKNVALVTMAGVLTKADMCTGEGSATLARQVAAAAANPNIQAIIVLSENCPGGQVDGTQVLADAIKAATAKKPVYGAISGMACSAAVWALTQCTNIYATSATDQFGCIGVMASYKEAADAKGSGRVVVYSDLSPDKNAESRDPDLLKKQYLNPVAALFHTAVKDGRGDRLKLGKNNVLSGLTYVAGNAVAEGLIDGIKPFSQIVAAALGDAKNKKPMSQNSNATHRFQNVLATAKATEIPLAEGGFLVNETQLQLLDETLATAATNTAALATAQAEVTRLTGELSTALATAGTATATAADQLTAAHARIAELEALDAPGATGKKPEEDKQVDGGKGMEKYLTSYDRIPYSQY